MIKLFTKFVDQIEMTAVLVRILLFSIISILGEKSPFLWVWSLNTIDAFVLMYCSIIKKNKAYIVLNFFWIVVGLIGVLKSI